MLLTWVCAPLTSVAEISLQVRSGLETNVNAQWLFPTTDVKQPAPTTNYAQVYSDIYVLVSVLNLLIVSIDLIIMRASYIQQYELYTTNFTYWYTWLRLGTCKILVTCNYTGLHKQTNVYVCQISKEVVVITFILVTDRTSRESLFMIQIYYLSRQCSSLNDKLSASKWFLLFMPLVSQQNLIYLKIINGSHHPQFLVFCVAHIV